MPNTNAGPAVSAFVNEVPLRGTFDTNGKLIQILGSGQNVAFDPANVAITGGAITGVAGLNNYNPAAVAITGGTATLNKEFIGTNTSSGDDSALLILRGLTTAYVTGYHAVRDETTYSSSGTGLHAYASFDSIPVIGGPLTYNHLHNFQARGVYNGTGVLNEFAAFTNDAQVAGTGVVNALRGVQINDATGVGTVTEQAGVWVNDIAKGANNYGVKVNLSTASNKYNIWTGTAQSLFNGLLTCSAGFSITGGVVSLPSSGQQLNFATNTNLNFAGAGTIASISSLNDAANAYGPLFLKASVITQNSGGAEITRATPTAFLVATSTDDGVNKLQVAGSIAIKTVGAGLRITEGVNGKQGSSTLAAGSVTVSTGNVTTNSRIMLTSQADGGTPGFLRVSSRAVGASFTITSSSATDTSIVAYQIFEPA